MKYPSADSLNSATDNSYNYDQIIKMEGNFLSVISWELLQYTVLDFLNLFLAQGCFFPTDRILTKDSEQKVTADQAVNVRKYAEFFTDFCIQEREIITESAHLMTCAVLAFTRKHLNCEVIWPHELELLAFTQFSTFKSTYKILEKKYAESFPEHATNQSLLVKNRQIIESPGHKQDFSQTSLDLSSNRKFFFTKPESSEVSQGTKYGSTTAGTSQDKSNKNNSHWTSIPSSVKKVEEIDHKKVESVRTNIA